LVFAAALLGLLLGSIPFGLILTRLAGLGDVRQIGIGQHRGDQRAAHRRKGLAAATVLLDAWPRGWWRCCWPGAGLPVWPGMKGAAARCWAIASPGLAQVQGRQGRGHARWAWRWRWLAGDAGLCASPGWAMLALSRISSLSGIAGSGRRAAGRLGARAMPQVPAADRIALIVIVQHRANIGRLMRGEEPKSAGQQAVMRGRI
jgi:acyl phosphate:glycerol-3-phosphate acyltransferase